MQFVLVFCLQCRPWHKLQPNELSPSKTHFAHTFFVSLSGLTRQSTYSLSLPVFQLAPGTALKSCAPALISTLVLISGRDRMSRSCFSKTNPASKKNARMRFLATKPQKFLQPTVARDGNTNSSGIFSKPVGFEKQIPPLKKTQGCVFFRTHSYVIPQKSVEQGFRLCQNLRPLE